MMDLLKVGIKQSYKFYSKQKNINYQKFSHHGHYHLIYYIMIYVQQKYKIENINILSCPETTFPGIYMWHIKELPLLFTKTISESELEETKKHKMIKLAGYNRSFIEKHNLEPLPNTLLHKLIF